jgi:peptide deformylase
MLTLKNDVEEEEIVMALRNIVKEGDSVLTKKCRLVTEFNPRLHQLLDDMRQTLLDADGVGLAAPQVGVLRRVVVVIDTLKEAEKTEDQIIELVNPEIIASEGEQYGLEGCLSVPGVFGMVHRPSKVTVRAQDRFGKEFEVTGFDLTARCFCHELDHLDGHLFREVADKILTPEELEELENGEKE